MSFYVMQPQRKVGVDQRNSFFVLAVGIVTIVTKLGQWHGVLLWFRALKREKSLIAPSSMKVYCALLPLDGTSVCSCWGLE